MRGNGFIVPEDEVLGTTRKGKQVLNLKAPDQAAALTTVDGELVAAIGENRKMVIFRHRPGARDDRGRGVRLQRYLDKGLSDVTTFKAEEGLTWIDAAGRNVHADDEGIEGLARQPRRCRPHPAGPISDEQQIRRR